MTAVRLGAVWYLNARPLVHRLDRQAERFSVRFDLPSTCATLLHEGSIDLGMIPSIEYLHRPDYYIVPDVAIVSTGPVASVALFTSRPIAAIRSIALDRSSRTSAALLRVLCAEWFDVEPAFVTLPPDLPAMLKRCDAALLIGDLALFADHATAGLDKIDLGAEWAAMTNLPFVWAFWAGRRAAIGPEHVAALGAARDAGVRAADEIAAAYCGDDDERVRVGRAYLRENMRYVLDERGRAGLTRFFESAIALRIASGDAALRFY